MLNQRYPWCALAGIILCGAHLMAQTSAAPIAPGAAVTTGMVGIAPTQTARINVLNLNPVVGTPVVCSVLLQFVDANDNVLKSATISNIPPGQAAGLNLMREEIPDSTVTREHIRGVVRNPLIPAAGSTAVPAGCSVFTTLEVFDDVSGDTLTFTSHVKPVPVAAVPVPAN